MPDAPTTDRPRPRQGADLELEIDSLAQGGRGVARSNGYVVFVSGALPGDRVRARLTRAKRHYGEAKAVELLRPSAERIADRCLHGGEPCPGAAGQGMVYERQLALDAGGDYSYFSIDPNVFWFWATPLPGQTPETLENSCGCRPTDFTSPCRTTDQKPGPIGEPGEAWNSRW